MRAKSDRPRLHPKFVGAEVLILLLVLALVVPMASGALDPRVGRNTPMSEEARRDAERTRMERERAYQQEMRRHREEQEKESLAKIWEAPEAAHEAYVLLCRIGTKRAVPILIQAFAGLPKPGGDESAICTRFRCIDALWRLTGKCFYDDQAAWEKWWNKEGIDLPESYFSPSQRPRLAEFLLYCPGEA